MGGVGAADVGGDAVPSYLGRRGHQESYTERCLDGSHWAMASGSCDQTFHLKGNGIHSNEYAHEKSYNKEAINVH